VLVYFAWLKVPVLATSLPSKEGVALKVSSSACLRDCYYSPELGRGETNEKPLLPCFK
jgi:hypothetical protein